MAAKKQTAANNPFLRDLKEILTWPGGKNQHTYKAAMTKINEGMPYLEVVEYLVSVTYPTRRESRRRELMNSLRVHGLIDTTPEPPAPPTREEEDVPLVTGYLTGSPPTDEELATNGKVLPDAKVRPEDDPTFKKLAYRSKINAIKEYRERTDAGLFEAKEAVEAIMANKPTYAQLEAQLAAAHERIAALEAAIDKAYIACEKELPRLALSILTPYTTVNDEPAANVTKPEKG